MLKVIVKTNDADQTLEKFLKKYLPSLPLSQVFRLIRKKQVKINGKKVNDSKYRLQLNDELVIFTDEVQATFKKQQATFKKRVATFKIVFENLDFLIVNKPKNLPVHDEKGEDNLDDQVLTYLIEKNFYDPQNENTFKPGHIHRIDAPTSGMVVYAKTKKAMLDLNEKIKDHKVFQKFYLATLEGKVATLGIVNGYIAKETDHVNKMKFFKNEVADSKYTSTVIKLLSYDSVKNQSKVEFQLLTGRKHQLRALSEFIGNPIVGDERYGAKTPGNLQLEAYRIIIDGKEYKI